MSYYQGDYYMAGGFFKRIGRFASRAVKTVSRVASNPAVGGVLTAVNPALGIGLSSMQQAVGRAPQLLSPSAAPAGMPSEGTPPFAPAFQQATYGGIDPAFMQLLIMLLLKRR